uniref:Repressor of RNA polymerase III transcription maf1 n=1 Tax=Nelumbo nucifera TaxID=4432 RepID=A0A822ZSX6_NELNU|nr:TPA_asm: hypothetical protein HUJ06_018288 [Nelumbo nucifera]
MKFLEYALLDSINDFLSHINLGECTIKGKLEAYSCKQIGVDRKLSLSLEHEILDYLGKSSDSDSPSSAEFLSSRSSRKTLVYLILTLSHMYPDYDFRYLCFQWYKVHFITIWRRIMGNATVSLLGGMATRYFLLSPVLEVLSNGLTDGLNNCCSKS